MPPRAKREPAMPRQDETAREAAAAPAGDLQVLTRSAQILRHLGQTRVPLRAAEIAPVVGLTRTTAHRYLTSLEAEGFLSRDQDGGYGLGPLLVELGAVAMSGQRVIDVADEFLERLGAMVQQTVVLSLWGGIGPVVAMEQVPPHQLVKISIQVGNRLPLESAQGLVFLAFMGGRRDQLLAQLTPGERTEIVNQLDDVVVTGLAINDRVTDGIRAIAAPVWDASGRICATLALVGTIHVLPADPESTAAMSLLDTARRLSAALGLTGAPPPRVSNGAAG
ncbi:MAG: hypothetical protein QOF25_4459 [Mycobacterium sp.]|nr:hypothetical protein [Mycobacterium sp.]